MIVLTIILKVGKQSFLFKSSVFMIFSIFIAVFFKDSYTYLFLYEYLKSQYKLLYVFSCNLICHAALTLIQDFTDQS